MAIVAIRLSTMSSSNLHLPAVTHWVDHRAEVASPGAGLSKTQVCQDSFWTPAFEQEVKALHRQWDSKWRGKVSTDHVSRHYECPCLPNQGKAPTQPAHRIGCQHRTCPVRVRTTQFRHAELTSAERESGV
jgi:hypothetical protein